MQVTETANLASSAATLSGVSPAAAPFSSTDLTVPEHDLRWIIGRGGYGEVWLARHHRLGVNRAIKVIRRASFEEARPFQRELEGIRVYEPVSRGHSNLIPILHVGGGEDHFYYIMELADPVRSATGAEYAPRTLRSELKVRGPLPVVEVVEIGAAIASALAHLHAHGLVHRDVKPSNVIFVSGSAKLADIGLVTGISDSRSYVGTEGYIPPEGPGIPSADCYGLGKLLYELSTGLDRNAWPQPPADLSQRADREQLLELNAILHKACSPNPEERFRSADQMRGELELLRIGESIRKKRSREQRWSVTKRVLQIGAQVAEFTAAANKALRRRMLDTDLHSEIPEVNNLLERGHICALAATPERLRQSARYFQQALDLHRDFIPACVGLFRAYLIELTALPQPSDAAVANVRAAAMRLIDLAPESAERCMAASFLKCLEGELAEALREIRNATKRPALSRQTRAVVRALFGSYLLNSGRPVEALEEFRLSEREVPTCAIVQVYLGHPQFILGNFPGAIAQYQKSIDFEPRQALGYFWKGRAFEETGEFARAIEEFELSEIRAFENSAQVESPGTIPDTTPTREKHDALRRALRKAGPAGYWRQRLEEAQSRLSPDPHLLATLFARTGDRRRAIELLERACEQGKINGLPFDHCWDKNDERFRRIAAKLAVHLA
jgi:serine/threonine protein kinase/tetratricopeptide (TPR) repeat protein